jgi:hypothetical protein
MAYQSEFNVDYWTGKLYKFSNPELTCKGVPCGVSRTNTTSGADAHYALNITGPQIEKFYTAPASSSSSLSSKASSSLASSKISSAASSKASSIDGFKASSKASSVSISVKASSSTKSVIVLVSSASSKSSFVSSSAKSSSQASIKASSSSVASLAKVEFNRVVDVAQYIGADWNNEIRRDKGLTLDQAKAIAAANPKITYFFIAKGGQMSLGAKGLFRTGDAVFFSGKPWYGSAKGLADAYERKL